jgi:hypothetical protein
MGQRFALRLSQRPDVEGRLISTGAVGREPCSGGALAVRRMERRRRQYDASVVPRRREAGMTAIRADLARNPARCAAPNRFSRSALASIFWGAPGGGR